MPERSPSAVSPVSPHARAVLALFDDDLARVTFPDVDAASLTAAVHAVEATAESVLAAEAALASARSALGDAVDRLERMADRAVAYARVFADGNAALATRLADLPPRSRPAVGEAAPVTARRRGRPRKHEGTAPLLAPPGDSSGDVERDASATSSAAE